MGRWVGVHLPDSEWHRPFRDQRGALPLRLPDDPLAPEQCADLQQSGFVRLERLYDHGGRGTGARCRASAAD